MGKVAVSRKGSDFVLVIPQEMLGEFGIDQNAEFELFKAKPGIWVLVGEKAASEKSPVDLKILALLKEKGLKDRVEGMFERFLGKEEMPRFREMVKEGSIVEFKLSPKYKRAVYKTRQEAEENVKMAENGKVKKPEPGNGKEKPIEGYSLDQDGFLVCRENEKARLLSENLRKEIEEGKIRGIKSFDGFFYIAEESLYQKYKPKILGLIKEEKGIGIGKIAEKAGISKVLARVVCEFLKEEGDLIEKRKDQFQAI